MKYYSFISFTILVFGISCSKSLSETEPNASIPLPPVDTTITSILYEGRFENGPFGATSGKVSILKTSNRYQLRLDSFKVSNGPDLKVYISKQRQPLDFYRVASLKAFQGDQEYDLSTIPDLVNYPYVLIHCEKFNHLFGSAILMEN